MKQIAWVVLCLLAPACAQAASFDCAKATTQVEKCICGNPELSRLDEELAAAYKGALKNAKHAQAVRQTEREWLKSRLSTCEKVHYDSRAISACIQTAYEQRLAWLKFPIMTDSVGRLLAARVGYGVTLLSDGKVLIAGGKEDNDALYPADVALDSAELYDPATRRSTATGNLMYARAAPGLISLPGGKVLVYGGYDNTGPRTDPMQDVDGVEIYDPESGKFSKMPDLPTGYGSIVPLANGKILGVVPSGADLADLATGRVTHVSYTTGSMFNRMEYTARLLKNGKVLVVASPSAELYDPEKNAFAETGKLSLDRQGYSVTLLKNGKVLVAGGFSNYDASQHSVDHLRSAELYDPATGRFSPTGELVTPRSGHLAFLLPNGKVMVLAGEGPGGRSETSVELYDPATGRFNLVGNFDGPANAWSFIPVKDGTVLILDGTSAKIYDPARQ